jgi:hypothetical protein
MNNHLRSHLFLGLFGLLMGMSLTFIGFADYGELHRMFVFADLRLLLVFAGGVFTIFPETGTAAPLGQARPLSPGVAYFALRTGAPIVPLILGGTHELYLGRRFVLRVLPSVTARELAGLAADAPLPERGTLAERDLARRITAALAALVEGPVAEVHAAAEPPPGTRKRWRWLTTATH